MLFLCFAGQVVSDVLRDHIAFTFKVYRVQEEQPMWEAVRVVKARKNCGANWGRCGGGSLPTTSPVHFWDPYNLISICLLGWYQLVSGFFTTQI